MRVFVLGFACGIWLLHRQAELPAPWLPAILLLAALLLQKSALAGRRLPEGARRLLLGLAMGFCWAAGLAHWRLADELPAAHEGRDIVVTGVVAGLPQAMARGTRFDFDVEEAGLAVPSRLSLAWYHGRDGEGEEGAAPSPLRAGERWRFTVRLKRPHGNANPHGFDYEGWLFERGIRATGYVRPRSADRLAERVWRPGYAVEMVRESLRDRYRAILADAPYGGVLVALAIGDQRAIAPELWQVFARTGITHLMSISGLHITMLAGLAWLLTDWLWRRFARLPLRLPAPQAAALGGLFAAFAYALLAGFAVPAQRTLYMLAVVALAGLLRRELAPSRVLAAALFVVLLRDPLAVGAAGFWLSFGAVALLFHVGGQGLGALHWLRAWGRAQWAVTLGLLPALLALFQQFSLVSPLANAIAIPVISLLVTPLTLAAAVPGLGALLWPAHGLLSLLMDLVLRFGQWPLAVWQQAAPPPWAVPLALAGAAWLLLPRGFPARWLGLLAFLPLLTLTPPRPAPGEAAATVLDVGQGLAVHVQTARHDLLFDAGPAFSADADSGSRIIVPYLRAMGVRRLDVLMLSHADKDHEGGAASVLAAVPVGALVRSLPADHPLAAAPAPQRPCRADDAWEWDGVRFELLHPPDAAATGGNGDSCVLRVTAAGRGLLLTGDIEAAQESVLAGRRPDALRADVLVAPHHGSGGSSTPAFVAAVGAREVIFSAGYRNRFGHPRPAVVARYEAAGARTHRTDLKGAVTVRLAAAGLAVEGERERGRRYWMNR